MSDGLTDLLETPSIAGYAFRGVTSEGVFPFVREINLEDLSVTNAKIRDATIESAKIADASITTAKIADLAVTNAKIASLAVTDAKIASLVADKITTGNLVATVSVTSGLIQTAAAGARVKLSSAGVELFDGANVRKVFLDAATGSAEFSGTVKASTLDADLNFTSLGQLTGTAKSTGMFQGRSDGTSGPAFKVGNDATLNDVGVANAVGIQGAQDATKGKIVFGSDKSASLFVEVVKLLSIGADNSFRIPVALLYNNGFAASASLAADAVGSVNITYGAATPAANDIPGCVGGLRNSATTRASWQVFNLARTGCTLGFWNHSNVTAVIRAGAMPVVGV